MGGGHREHFHCWFVDMQCMVSAVDGNKLHICNFILHIQCKRKTHFFSFPCGININDSVLVIRQPTADCKCVLMPHQEEPFFSF